MTGPFDGAGSGKLKENAIAFSCGFGPYDNLPEQFMAEDADEFIGWINDNRTAAKGEKWISAPFRQQCTKAMELGRPHRCATCVQDAAFLGLDVDGGLTAESAAFFIQLMQRYRGVVYPTASHTEALPRYRAIPLLDRGLSRKERIEMSAKIRGEVDRAMIAAGYDPPQWDPACDRPEQPLYLAVEGAPVYRLEGAMIRTADYAAAGLMLGDHLARLNLNGPSAFAAFSPSATFGHYSDSGKVVEVGRHDDVLKLAGQLARMIVHGGLSRRAALAAMDDERKRGRWSRVVADGEMVHALDGALENFRSGEWPTEAANDADLQVTTLAGALARELTPFTDQDYARASVPHPHVFSDGNAGMFPVGEVTTIAAPGREGKTTVTTYIVSRAALGWTIAGLPSEPMRVVIYSNEDDRVQYARKVLALRSQLPAADSERLHHALVVPDLEAPDLVQWRTLVELTAKGRPVPTGMVNAIIEALRPLTEGSDRVGIVVFETVSTLSEADEDNPGLKALTAAAKRIARALNVAAVLVHHTNQSAGQNYKDLNFSVADLRGGTVLPYNSRQCLLLVSLGSDQEPFPADDGRTHLRKFIVGRYDGLVFNPAAAARASALIPLDTSKAANPCPAFFVWEGTPYGPVVREVLPPDDYTGMMWLALRQALVDRIKEEKQARKAAKVAQIDLLGEKARERCIEAVRELESEGRSPTVKAVSVRLHKSNDWAKPYLASAVTAGLLARTTEKVPHTKGEYDVYRLPPAGRDND